VIKARAVNDDVKQGPLLYIKPDAPKITYVNNKGEESIMVRWTPQTEQKSGGSPIVGYELVWEAEDLDNAHRKAHDGITTKGLTHNMIGAKAVYRFRLRAKNVCGYGAFSSIVKMDTRTPPNVMDSVVLTSAQNSCTSTISWKAPVHGGLPL
jgi:hypothetical protein